MGYIKGLECWAENSATLHFQQRPETLYRSSPPPLALLNYGKALLRVTRGRVWQSSSSNLCSSLSPCLPGSFSPNEKNERSFTGKKFGLLRMGYTVMVWCEGHWPKLLFPSLPGLLDHQQLQGSLVLQSFPLHSSTPVWLRCTQDSPPLSHMALNPVK